MRVHHHSVMTLVLFKPIVCSAMVLAFVIGGLRLQSAFDEGVTGVCCTFVPPHSFHFLKMVTSAYDANTF